MTGKHLVLANIFFLCHNSEITDIDHRDEVLFTLNNDSAILIIHT